MYFFSAVELITFQGNGAANGWPIRRFFVRGAFYSSATAEFRSALRPRSIFVDSLALPHRNLSYRMLPILMCKYIFRFNTHPNTCFAFSETLVQPG